MWSAANGSHFGGSAGSFDGTLSLQLRPRIIWTILLGEDLAKPVRFRWRIMPSESYALRIIPAESYAHPRPIRSFAIAWPRSLNFSAGRPSEDEAETMAETMAETNPVRFSSYKIWANKLIKGSAQPFWLGERTTETTWSILVTTWTAY